MSLCRRFFVSGTVQGVFFRASTARRARELGLTGYARNLRDGRVEVLACGPEAAIAQLGEWLWQGSAASAVDNVSSQEAEDAAPPTFTTA